MSNEPLKITLDLSSTSLETLELFLDLSEDAELFQEICEANFKRPDALRMLLCHDGTPEGVRASAANLLSLPVPSHTELETIKQEAQERRSTEAPAVRAERLMLRVQHMSVAERMKLAQKGNAEARGMLIRDSHKSVALSVLDNPRITETEVENAAHSRALHEDALRTIAKRVSWMRIYTIKLALTTNPKTPLGVSMTLLPTLRRRDLEGIEKNRNVPQALRITAAKYLKGLH